MGRAWGAVAHSERRWAAATAAKLAPPPTHTHSARAERAAQLPEFRSVRVYDHLPVPLMRAYDCVALGCNAACATLLNPSSSPRPRL